MKQGVTIENMVWMENGTRITNSLVVADFFCRRHKNILKSVRRLIEQGNGIAFKECRQGRFPYYKMTKDGFVKVVSTLPDVADKMKAVVALFDGEQVAPVAVPAPVMPEIGQIIHIQQKQGVQTMSARELHTFLDSRQDFSTWIKDRIDKYGFIQNQDYAVIHTFVDNDSRITNDYTTRIGRPTIEYILSIDMAKELAMVEGNERGKFARRYFIEVEKKFRQTIQEQVIRTTPAIPTTFAEALRLAASQAERIEAQQKQIEADAPKVTFATAVEASKTACLIGELAKLLCQNGVKTGEKRLFAWLRENGYLCKFGDRYNQPTQRALEMGLFKVKKQTWTKPNGQVMTSATTMVTGKGQVYFINKLIYNTQNQQPK